MARVTYSAEINELQGSVGGTTFQRNGSGTISRLKNIRRGRPSFSRQGVNLVLNSVVKQWTALSLAQQIVWNDYALLHTKFNYFGSEKVLNGFNWYVSINSNRSITGQALLSAPPVYSTPGLLPLFNLYLTSDDIEIDFDPFAGASDYYFFIYITPPIFSQSVKNRSKIRLLGSFDVGAAEYANLTSEFETVFGISWPPSIVENSFYLLCSIALVSKSTGISGQFTSVISPFLFA